MKRYAWFVLPLSLSIAVPALADPQKPGPSAEHGHGQGPGGKGFRQRVLKERVGLNDAKADRVSQLLEKYAPERKRLRDQTRDARQKLKALVGANSTDQAAFRTALDQVRTSHKAMVDLMDRAFAEVSKDLTPGEQARLFLALDGLRGKMKGHGRGHDDD
jgi:Spy/CpxP family protein refolding chaperone